MCLSSGSVAKTKPNCLSSLASTAQSAPPSRRCLVIYKQTRSRPEPLPAQQFHSSRQVHIARSTRCRQLPRTSSLQVLSPWCFSITNHPLAACFSWTPGFISCPSCPVSPPALTLRAWLHRPARMALEDDGSVAALVCDNGSGMVKVGARLARASALRWRLCLPPEETRTDVAHCFSEC